MSQGTAHALRLPWVTGQIHGMLDRGLRTHRVQRSNWRDLCWHLTPKDTFIFIFNAFYYEFKWLSLKQK